MAGGAAQAAACGRGGKALAQATGCRPGGVWAESKAVVNGQNRGRVIGQGGQAVDDSAR